MNGNTPSEKGSNTDPLERLYVGKELFTFEVSGITFKVRDLNAEDMFAITKKSMVDGELIQSVYARELMKSCIMEPAIDFSKEMKGVVVTQILGHLEDVLGLSELAQKKLVMR